MDYLLFVPGLLIEVLMWRLSLLFSLSHVPVAD
jgi:hypothetical protein